MLLLITKKISIILRSRIHYYVIQIVVHKSLGILKIYLASHYILSSVYDQLFQLNKLASVFVNHYTFKKRTWKPTPLKFDHLLV